MSTSRRELLKSASAATVAASLTARNAAAGAEADAPGFAPD